MSLLSLTLFGVFLAALLGSLIGSFANVVVHRLPKGASIAFPGSHCPACNHRLTAQELVPVLSWIAQLGRCRNCRAPISLRYPLLEAIMALGFALLWLRWPPQEAGWTFLPLAALFAVLVILAAIDLDTYTLPDVLTLPALLLALSAPLILAPQQGLPSFSGALAGAAVGAGVLTLVGRIGALLMRRMRDTGERLWPVGFDQVNLAALAGMLAGWRIGLLAAAASLAANLLLRRTLRLPEQVLIPLWPAALLLGVALVGLGPATALAGGVIAAGAVAIAGSLYWWLHDLLLGQAAPKEEAAGEEPAGEEPVAMGFGDVKLAALMGALLGWQGLLLALFLAFLLGALGGVAGRLLGGERVIPFGPYLVLATVLTLFQGETIIAWYLGLLGV